MKPKAILIDTKDNVATAFQDLSSGDTVTVSLEGTEITTTITQDIPFGHKFALSDIAIHEPIVKYGEAIGLATEPIKAGRHVHVHNLESQKGRGDK
ncbi:MAG: UxaA family hydrolase [Dehalococcoidia bacterium]|nr:UxaA family hydrolase [Dehalococcoidia bacterium]